MTKPAQKEKHELAQIALIDLGRAGVSPLNKRHRREHGAEAAMNAML